MWAVRIVHESCLHESDRGNCFVTLTYRSHLECTERQLRDQLHIPDDWSLHVRHFQLFAKRLRASTKARIKYFHCGEYGDQCLHGPVRECNVCNVGRPHYHAVLFNQRFDDLVEVGSKNGVPYYTSPRLEALWGYGFVQVGEVTFESAAYVARYALKKVNGNRADDHYLKVDSHGELLLARPEYVTMSNGIGREWYERYRSDFHPRDHAPVPGRAPIGKVPRYYDELLKRTDPITHQAVKDARQRYRREHPEEFQPNRLMAKYKVKRDQIAQLKRGLTP